MIDDDLTQFRIVFKFNEDQSEEQIFSLGYDKINLHMYNYEKDMALFFVEPNAFLCDP